MKFVQSRTIADDIGPNMEVPVALDRAGEYRAASAPVDIKGPISDVPLAPDPTPLRVVPPALFCPFPAAVHADARRIEEGTIAWMKRYGYIKTPCEEATARNAQFGIRAARVHPAGCTEAIQLVSDLTVWLFLTDDVYVEQPGTSNALSITTEHIIHCIRILRNPEDLPPVPNASLLALQDISRRVRAMATHEQMDRVVNGMLEYFLAACCEAVAISRKSLPKVTDYVSLRDSINCLRSVCFVFIEIVGRYELSGPTWCRPDLQAVVNKATRIIANHHDVLSGLRELTEDVPMNLPAVIARSQGLPMAEAFARVGALADADTRTFIHMTGRLLADEPDPSVKKYVDGLKAWIRGNLDWSLTTGRYRVGDYL